MRAYGSRRTLFAGCSALQTPRGDSSIGLRPQVAAPPPQGSVVASPLRCGAGAARHPETEVGGGRSEASETKEGPVEWMSARMTSGSPLGSFFPFPER